MRPSRDFGRFLLIWLVASAIATPLVAIFLTPSLPPGVEADDAAGQKIDNGVLTAVATPTVLLIVIFLGERLTAGQGAAIAMTFVGVVVASTDFGEVRRTLGRPVEGVRYGLVATGGFAVWGVLYAVAVRATDGLGMILLLRASSVLLLIVYVLVRRTSFAPLRDRRALILIVIVGVLDTGANVLLSLGIASGFASFVMTGSGAYPLIPALLAIAVLRERLAPNQYVGVALLVAGLVALGLQS